MADIFEQKKDTLDFSSPVEVAFALMRDYIEVWARSAKSKRHNVRHTSRVLCGEVCKQGSNLPWVALSFALASPIEPLPTLVLERGTVHFDQVRIYILH